MNATQPLLFAALLLLALEHGSSRATAETSAALSVDATVDTRAAELSTPVSGSINASPVVVAFYLPLNALSNTVKLVFTGSVTRELTLAAVHETMGTHSVAFDPGNPTASPSVAAGGSLPDGFYTLTVSYRDATGDAPPSNPMTNLMIDRTPPVLTLPTDMAVEATGDAGAVVNYPAAGATDTIGVTSLIYSKASGTLFPIGVTTVTVTAKDAANNTSVASFNITVNGVQIAVEYPPGTDLIDAAPAPVDFGTVVAGDSKTLTFTIRNRGTRDLTGLALTKAANGNPGDFYAPALGAATLAPQLTTTFPVTFSPSAAGVRNAILRIINNDPDENPFDINLTGRQATPTEAWRMTYFGSFSNTGPGADLSDPDADGSVNLLEYATASDPTVSTPPPGHLIKIGDQLEFTYTRPSAATQELTYTPETCTSLTGPWLPADPAATHVVSDDGLLQQVKVTITAGPDGKLFLRLRVTRP
jgi:hypothetical protein